MKNSSTDLHAGAGLGGDGLVLPASPRRRRLGAARWRELIDLFDSGVESLDVFCVRHGASMACNRSTNPY